MRKVFNIVIGGLQQKIFNLVLITMILTVAAYTGVLMYQSRNLTETTRQTNKRQQASIEEISDSTMEAVVRETMNKDIVMESYIADNVFRKLKEETGLLADYARKLYADPDAWPRKEVSAPDPENDGKASVQLVSEAGIDLEDPEIADRTGLAANMGEMFLALFNTAQIDACFIGTEDGAFIITDSRSAEKFDESGQQRTIDVRNRPWYVGAKETGDLYFTDVELDNFSGKKGIVCSMPVYQDGKLAAVVGIDYFLDTMEKAVADSGDEQTSFVCIINHAGHVIFAPDNQDLFKVEDVGHAVDLRRSENTELAEFVAEALTSDVKVRAVHVGDKEYYMAGAPMETVGWAVISVIDAESTRQPTVMMQDQYEKIYDETVAKLQKDIGMSLNTILVLLLFIFAAGSAAALYVAKRIVSPLNTITKRIAALGGNNLQFMMEDEYRTGDEVEVLAQSFADLSAKTVRYVDEVRRVSAEKERISVELGMATAIQESQLPHLFPAYPERNEFDVYATMTPAKEVGGDFYDFFLVDHDHLCLVMADVSGKGIPAALFMMIARILIRNEIQGGRSPAQALANVNSHLLEGNELGLFVTVWLAVLELSTGKGTAANAGHEHPVLRKPDGHFEFVKYRHSPPVASIEGIPYRQHEFRLEPGDSLFVYTDGVAEAADGQDVLFGEARLLTALNRDPDADPENVLRNVMRGINEFVAGAEQFDDITMLCLKYFGPQDENLRDRTAGGGSTQDED